MATAAKKTAPAAKKAAPAPAPAAKKAPVAAKKAAPAPKPEPVEEEVAAVEAGSFIRFLGYPEGTEEKDQLLEAGTIYTVEGVTEPEGDDPGGDPYVTIPNPDFNAKKKESDDNPKTIAVSVLPDEYEVVSEEEATAEAAAAEEVVEEPAAPAPAAKKSVGKKAAAVAPAEEEAAAEEGEAEEEVIEELEGEDEAVLELVNSGESLIEVAQGLETNAAESEYRLAGVLFHIKKNKTYLTEVDGGEQYNVPGGFTAFLRDYFNIEYRKAMYLIDIYVAFTKAQVPDPAARMAAMGWAKASKIAKPMLEGANADDLLKLADENTVKDLTEAIKEQIEVGGTRTPGVKVTRTTLKFRLLEQDGTTVTHVLEAVREAQALKDATEALMFIINDWAAANASAALAAAAPKATTAVGKKPAAKAAAKAETASVGKKTAPVPPKPKARA